MIKKQKMSKERQTDPALIQPGLDPTEVLRHIRKWNESFREDAAFNPPFTHDEVHRLISSPRPSQADLLRQADAYLLTLCLLLLALESSILWHTLPLGHTVLNIATIVLGVISLWGAYRAALSLYYQWQMHRLCHHPYRMLRFSDRLHRLSHRRRWWINTVLWPNHATSAQDSPRIEIATLRISSYAIAVCLSLLIFVNSDKAFASTRTYANVTTNTEKTATAIYDSVNQTIMQIWNNNSTRKNSGLL